MSQPLVRVLVDFETVDLSANPFQLDDPVNAILDTSELASSEAFDLSYLVKSVSINRGRSRQLDQFNAGSAVVVFNNADRILDPTNTDSQFYPFVLPRVGLRVLANGIPIFYGLVVDWNLEYDQTGQDVMTAVCSDDFAILANQVLDAYTPVEQLSGDRIDAVLSRPEVGYEGSRQIGTGTSTLGDFPVSAGTNVLNYLQLIAKSEQGFLYTSANGVLTFKGKDESPNKDPSFLFNDTGTGIPYRTLLNQFGDELLFNYVITESPAGGPFVASDLASQVKYQYQQLVLSDLLNSSSEEVEDIGTYLLGKYKDPYLRFTGVTCQLNGLSVTQQNTCFEIDLTDICTVEKSFDSGLPATVSQNLVVSGVTHQITPDSHTIGFAFELGQPDVTVTGAATDVTADGYRTVTWTSSGSITPDYPLVSAEYLVVAGGGGGGKTDRGGGGGAGGGVLVGFTTLTGTTSVAVGTGGTAGTTAVNATNGGDSTLGTLVATGGGRGGGTPGTPNIGGSGGGGGHPQNGAAGTSGQGFAGGDGQNSLALGRFCGGGGGGAGQAGAGGASGVGGNGVESAITGTLTYYAGGGGAGLQICPPGTATGPGSIAAGGLGGGGGTAAGTQGTDGLGGGGCGGTGTTGGAGDLAAGDGGNGIVIVRWRL